MNRLAAIEQYGVYLVLLSLWETAYVYYYYGIDGVVPYSIIPLWIVILAPIAAKTDYAKLYRYLFIGVSLVGTAMIAGRYALLVSVEYLLAVCFGAVLVLLNGDVK